MPHNVTQAEPVSRHTIAMPDTVEFEHELAGAYGKGEHKTLVACTTVVLSGKPAVRFIVREHRSEVFRSEDLARAVEIYNAT